MYLAVSGLTFKAPRALSKVLGVLNAADGRV